MDRSDVRFLLIFLAGGIAGHFATTKLLAVECLKSGTFTQWGVEFECKVKKQ